MSDPAQPSGFEPPPAGYGAAPAYGDFAGATYKGSRLGLPPSGPNSLASPWRRLGARLIDGLVLFIPIMAIYLGMAEEAFRERDTTEPINLFAGDFLPPTLLVIVLLAVYEIVFLTRSGATPGKKAVGVRVARMADGTNPDLQAATVRWALGSLPGALPYIGLVYGLVNPAWCLWDEKRQCLHDKPVNTIVVNT